MSEAIFIKCFSSEDAEKLKEVGFTFFKEEYDEYIFFNDSAIQFSNSNLNIEFFDDVNC